MPRPEAADLEKLIEVLTGAKLDFIVVGGAAAALHGAPISTIDLDIVYSREPENLDRLQATLEKINAVVRDPAGRQLLPTREHLEAGGQLQLLTDLGPIDLLGQLHDGRGFEALFERSEVIGEPDLRLRVLDLQTLIEVKTATARAKDRLVIPILLALLGQDERP